MLKDKILNKTPGIITYGLTPPKQSNPIEKVKEIVENQIKRIQNLPIDGLILYDIQEEAERSTTERPFPFLPTIDPIEYGQNYLKDLKVPKINYCCVGKYCHEQLSNWIESEPQNDRFTVFVGASSHKQVVKMKLADAYQLGRELNPQLIVGGITIPERHSYNSNEHLRIIQKIENGCRFFVSQTTYHCEASKNLLSDYYYYCQAHHLEMVPILFSFSPCGSLKTLEFMKWLGISIPKWLENDLVFAQDILEKSLEQEKLIFEELYDFALERQIPIGCNIESVAVRKVEIDAAVQLVHDLRKIIQKVSS